jgi:hypothetical protein
MNTEPLKGFESSILESWGGWDQYDMGCFMFYKSKLKIDLGPHKAGDVVDIHFDLNDCQISTWDGGPKPVYQTTFKLVPETP